jgi:hypothetical protein
VVLRKKLTVLLAMVMMLGVMSVSPATADPKCGLVEIDPGVFVYLCENNGNKPDDGADVNKGGGQEHIRNAHPPHGGGEKHGGGSG